MPGTRARWLAALALIVSLAPLTRASALPSAPTFSLPAVHGETTLDSLRGHVVLVDFWASWCTPCRGSFPWMASLQQRYGPKGLEIVAINVDKDRALAERFLASHAAPFTVAFDPAGRTAQRFHVAAMPTSFLIGRDGQVLMSHQGFDPKKTADLEKRIAAELGP